MSDVSKAETTQMLVAMPLFTGLTKRQLSSVAKAVDHASFEPGAELVTEHDEVQRLIIIRSGTAAVTRRGVVTGEGGGVQQGASRRIGTVGPGDVVGELSILDGQVASASVVAETPLDALLLYRTRFNKLLASMPELYPRLLAGMAARIRAIDRHHDVIG
jgi:CRP/FNR family cyclic AMP-dependent transcriptional regulator